MRKNLFLLVTGVFVSGFLIAMEEEDPLPPTPKEAIAAFLVAKNHGRSGVRALATPRGESSARTMMRSDFRKTELEIYQQHVVPSIMKDELALKANPHLYIDEPIPMTMLLSGPDGMRPGLLAKTLAKIVDADYQEILHWRAKGQLDLMKGFAVTGDEKRDKVIFIRDIALLGRDLQGNKEQAHMVLYDQVKNSIKALQQRKGQVDHRVYVVASTAYEEALPEDIKALFEKKYTMRVSDAETALAVVGGFVTSLNGSSVPLNFGEAIALQGLDFEDLKDLVTESAKVAVNSGGEVIAQPHLVQALSKIRESHEKERADRAAIMKTLVEKTKNANDKEDKEAVYDGFVMEHVPNELRSLYEHRASTNAYYHDPRVYLFTGERGLGKTMAAQALAERRNAEFIEISVEDLIDPVVGKTQKKLEEFFGDLKQREKKGKSFVLLLRGVERLVPTSKFGDEEYEMKSLRASLLAQIKELGEHGVLLLGADCKCEKIHQDLVAAIGSERCVEFKRPRDKAVCAQIIASLSKRLIKQETVAVDFAALAEKVDAFTCADLEYVVRSAARKAADNNALAVAQVHFEQALSDVEKIVRAREEGFRQSNQYS